MNIKMISFKLLEKTWGACASIVRAYGEKHCLEHYRHRDLEEIMSKLVSKTGKELGLLWGACLRLHSNFYENFMVKDDVKMMIEAVKEFVGKMKTLIEEEG
ncbi:hypothetical protein SJAV_08790 [Sulfurisphaera javensis]|uniref:HEPN domain-containing protein n=1 Tax=Sulfurisphaera javensis TaxID=2049879 RepID=A0AAT9GPR9_9CREN